MGSTDPQEDTPETAGRAASDDAGDTAPADAASTEPVGAASAEPADTASTEPADAASTEPADTASTDPASEASATSALTGGTPRADSAARPVARKEYYAISEVADLVGLPAHVLRYWESQFPVLSPSKNRSGNRVYQRKEIKLILLVKQLLHVEKYTVEGAKQRIDQLRKGGELPGATAHALDDQMVAVLREELLELRELLTQND